MLRQPRSATATVPPPKRAAELSLPSRVILSTRLRVIPRARGIKTRVLEATGVGVFGSGSFQNSANSNGRMGGLSAPCLTARSSLRLAKATGPCLRPKRLEILMRANWSYVDAPGTLGVSYGLQTNETEIIAMRSSLGVARTFGPKWSGGAVLGLVYNTNNLNAPYIFQQQPPAGGPQGSAQSSDPRLRLERQRRLPVSTQQPHPHRPRVEERNHDPHQRLREWIRLSVVHRAGRYAEPIIQLPGPGSQPSAAGIRCGLLLESRPAHDLAGARGLRRMGPGVSAAPRHTHRWHERGN